MYTRLGYYPEWTDTLVRQRPSIRKGWHSGSRTSQNSTRNTFRHTYSSTSTKRLIGQTRQGLCGTQVSSERKTSILKAIAAYHDTKDRTHLLQALSFIDCALGKSSNQEGRNVVDLLFTKPHEIDKEAASEVAEILRVSQLEAILHYLQLEREQEIKKREKEVKEIEKGEKSERRVQKEEISN